MRNFHLPLKTACYLLIGTYRAITSLFLNLLSVILTPFFHYSVLRKVSQTY